VKSASALALVALLGVACHRDEPAAAPSAPIVEPELPADLSIELERTWCLGPCPTYVVKIDATGHVTWDGLKYVDAKGPQSAQIPVESVRKLLAQFEALAFTTLHDQYDVLVTDIAGATVTLRTRGATKQVFIRGAGMIDENFGSPSFRVTLLVWDDQDEDVKPPAGVHAVDEVDEVELSAKTREQQQEYELAKYGPTYRALDDLATAIDKAANTAQWIGTKPKKWPR
jgi:hypothetical protein